MSLVWECFSPPKEDPDDSNVKKRWCLLGQDLDKKHCKQSYKVFKADGSRETTSTYKKHLDSKHPGWDEQRRSSVVGHIPRENRKSIIRQKALGFPSKREMKAKSELMREMALKRIVCQFLECNTAFRCIEKENTKKNFKELLPGISIPDRKQLANFVHLSAAREKKKIYDAVQHVSSMVLCIDLWKANNETDFLAVLAMYIDDTWNLHCSLLGFEVMQKRHTGVNIAEMLDSITEEAGVVPSEQVAAVVSDSGSDVLKAVEQWQDQNYGEALNGPTRFADGFFLVSLPCMAHTVNNGIKKGFTGTTGLQSLVKAVRNAVVWIRNSGNHRRWLKEAQSSRGEKQLVPLKDNDTRWHSTQVMLERYLVIREAMKDVVATAKKEASRGTLKKIDDATSVLFDDAATEQITRIEQILAEMKIVTRKLETQAACALNYVLLVYFHLTCNILMRKEDDVSAVCHFKQTVKSYLGERIGKQCIDGAVATCTLDPRFLNPKAAFDEVEAEEVDYLINWLAAQNSETRLKTFVKAYWSRMKTIPYGLSANDLEDSTPHEETISLFSTLKSNLGFSKVFTGEVNVYMTLAQNSTLPPLQFWEKHENTLPLLAGAARLLMPFPASSAPAERVFSIAGWVFDERRESMLGSTLSHTLLLKHAWLGWLDCASSSPRPPSDEEHPLTVEEAIEEDVDEDTDEAVVVL